MSAADIEPSPENGGPDTKWFRWPAAVAQPGEPAWFKIARLDRPEYQEALATTYRKHGVRASKPNRRPENLRRAQIQAMAESVLLSWKGDVLLDRGKPFAYYSPENAKRALEIDLFRDWVISIAQNPGNF